MMYLILLEVFIFLDKVVFLTLKIILFNCYDSVACIFPTKSYLHLMRILVNGFDFL